MCASVALRMICKKAGGLTWTPRSSACFFCTSDECSALSVSRYRWNCGEKDE
jgi:hypothetical protein